MFQIEEIYPAKITQKDLAFSSKVNNLLLNQTYMQKTELKHKLPFKFKIIKNEITYKMKFFKPVLVEKTVISTKDGSAIITAKKLN